MRTGHSTERLERAWGPGGSSSLPGSQAPSSLALPGLWPPSIRGPGGSLSHCSLSPNPLSAGPGNRQQHLGAMVQPPRCQEAWAEVVPQQAQPGWARRSLRRTQQELYDAADLASQSPRAG